MSCRRGAGSPILTTFMDVVTINFTILDPNATANLTWGAIEVYDDGIPTQYSNGTFTNVSNIVLPIELISFTARIAQEQATLQWETVSESNNEGFEVEHSTNNQNWTRIGYVEGKGTTSLSQKYNFKTEKLPVGTHYFRLKQKDFDGRFTYSKTVKTLIEVVFQRFNFQCY